MPLAKDLKIELKTCEDTLANLVKADKNNWAKFYIMFKKVEDKELYKARDFRSFTAWLKDFALRNGIHESVLWNRKKAGKMYKIYEETQAKKGIKVVPMEEANISMDSLVLLDKIQKKSPELGANLIKKAMDKQITRTDLRQAYKKIKKEEEEANKPKKSSRTSKEIKVQNNKSTITAMDITYLLKDSTWLLGYKVDRKPFATQEQQDKYKTFAEFRVYTGTSKKSRRADVMLLENVTVNNRLHQVHAHAIEIKISKHDLLNDKKYTEYAEFAHFLWLAVPEQLVEIVEETAPPSVGIIAVRNNTLVKVRDAEKKEKPKRIVDTLMVAAIKLI